MNSADNQWSDDQLRALLSGVKTIAMIGASSRLDRPSHGVMKVLLHAGFRVIPITPREDSVLGQRAFKTLADVPEQIDVVDVFRRADETPPIAREAVSIAARVFWLQLGIVNEEAATIARQGGLSVVMDRCIGQTVHRLGITV